MRVPVVAVACVLAGLSAPAAAKLPPLRDPVFLNIGFVCQWENSCIARQQKAMKRSLAYVKKTDPPDWKIHLCNRNASRGHSRTDWIGYEHCIRNPGLRPASASSRRR